MKDSDTNLNKSLKTTINIALILFVVFIVYFMFDFLPVWISYNNSITYWNKNCYYKNTGGNLT